MMLQHRILLDVDDTRPKIFVLLRLLTALIGLCFWSCGVGDADLGWHLVGGQWIAEHGAVPHADPINTFNHSWIDYHWLCQLVFYLLYSLGGFTLLRICFGLVMALFFLCLYDIISACMEEKASPFIALALLLLAGVILSQVASPRPQTIELYLQAVALRTMLRPRGSTRYELPQLVLLTIAAANVQVYWIFIPCQWFALRVVPDLLAGRRELLHSSGALLLLALAGAANPYGLTHYALLYHYLFTPVALQWIEELNSGLCVAGETPYLLAGYFMLLALLLSQAPCRREKGRLLLALVAGALPVMAVRFLGLMIMGLPFLAQGLALVFAARAPRLARVERRFALPLIGALVVLGLGRAAVGFPGFDAGEKAAALRRAAPIDACAAVSQAPLQPGAGRDHLRVLTHFDFGGWCAWSLMQAAPHRRFRITTDGRTQFVPAQLFEQSFGLYELRSGWQDTLRDWDPDAAVVPKAAPLAKALSSESGWRLEYDDQRFAAFIRVR